MFAWGEKVVEFEQLEHYREIKGIAATIGMPTYKILTINYLYSLSVFCTSIVARQADGTIIHGRNQDYGWPDQMRNDSFIGEFYKDGKMIYSGLMFAGDTGLYTAEKNGAFSLSLNARHPESEDHVKNFVANLVEIFSGWKQLGWVIRDTFTNCNDFACAKEALTTEQVISPGYIILGGLSGNEGVVISRDKSGPANIRTLSDDTWFLVQTNDDHFAGVCQERCQVANANMNKLTPETINAEVLFNDVML